MASQGSPVLDTGVDGNLSKNLGDQSVLELSPVNLVRFALVSEASWKAYILLGTLQLCVVSQSLPWLYLVASLLPWSSATTF